MKGRAVSTLAVSIMTSAWPGLTHFSGPGSLRLAIRLTAGIVGQNLQVKSLNWGGKLWKTLNSNSSGTQRNKPGTTGPTGKTTVKLSSVHGQLKNQHSLNSTTLGAFSCVA